MSVGAPPRALVARLRRAIEIGGPIGALAIVASFAAWPPTRSVETGASRAYPELRPRVYACGAADALAAARRAVTRLPRWREVVHDPAGGALRCEARAWGWGLVDDVAITCTSRGAGAHVWLKSVSRGGPFDFGRNARNIAAFFAALDQELPGIEREEER